MSKPISIIQSPYKGDIAKNLAYANRCIRDSIERGELPIASHVFYTGALDDDIPEERETGFCLESALMDLAMQSCRGARCVVYTDLGISSGMKRGIETASAKGIQVLFRELDNG